MENNTQQSTLKIITSILKTIDNVGGDAEVAFKSATSHSLNDLPDLSVNELLEIRTKLEMVMQYVVLLNE